MSGVCDNSEVVYYFKMLLAGKKIEIECLDKNVFYTCRDYLTTFDKPDFVVRASKSEIKEELENVLGVKLYKENPADKIAVEYIGAESNVILRKIAKEFIEYDILLIHGASISIDNKCFVFTAPSGIGKTTHILNWIKRIPRTIIVNGDKPFVDVKNKIVFGTPWSGKEGFNTNISVPLAGIIALERGTENSICRIPFSEMLPFLIQQSYIPEEKNLTIKGYQLISQLGHVPCYKLICNQDEESALIAYNGLCINE